ncbi:MAG: hypothetical protein KF850_00880 [Labilithrix sp.]|nr:hypothetical protein [Labilithrix sp.]
MTTTATKWAERVREWRASGKTADEFAVGFEFQASTLRYWASRLKTDAMQSPSPMLARVIRERPSSTPQAAMTRATQAELAISVGGTHILVRRGFDTELLREVVAALGSAS